MKKLLFVLALLVSSSAYAANNIDVCNGCRVYYSAPRKTVTRTVPVPVPVPVAPATVLVDPYAYYQQPVAVQYYPAPAPVPVAPPPPTVCAWYVDPYDLFGQLFGNPDLVQSCW